jgi:hypothetical protein
VNKPLQERRADSLEKLALGLVLGAFLGDSPFWLRLLFLISALIFYALSELFAREGDRT